MQVQCFEVGPLPTNCYLLTDGETNKSAVIDPGGNDAALLEAVARCDVAAILLTHAHFDHILGVADVYRLTHAPIFLDADYAPMANDPRRNLSAFMHLGQVKPFTPARLLHDGDTFSIGALQVRVLHTPGHTPGGCCYLAGDALFSGDTLMAGSVGRTDFPGGDYRALMRSVQRLKALPGDWHIYPGHGPDTTLERERRANPYMEPERYGLIP